MGLWATYSTPMAIKKNYVGICLGVRGYYTLVSTHLSILYQSVRYQGANSQKFKILKCRRKSIISFVNRYSRELHPWRLTCLYPYSVWILIGGCGVLELPRRTDYPPRAASLAQPWNWHNIGRILVLYTNRDL